MKRMKIWVMVYNYKRAYMELLSYGFKVKEQVSRDMVYMELTTTSIKKWEKMRITLNDMRDNNEVYEFHL